MGKAWDAAHPEKWREYRQRWNKSERGKASHRRWKERHPVQAAAIALRNNMKRRGLFLSKEEAMVLVVQRSQGACAICGKLAPLHVDHKNQRVRGLLCPACNRGLGCFDDSSRLLRQAAKYVEEEEV